MVFVDDLDRCLPEKAVELLEAIKLFLDLEGYLFILGVNRLVVEEGIRRHYAYPGNKADDGGQGGKAGTLAEEYLEKMIQMPPQAAANIFKRAKYAGSGCHHQTL